MPLRSITLSLLVICALSSCAFRSAIDESGNIRPTRPHKLANAYGSFLFERIKKKKPISHAPRYTDPVDRVAKRLTQVIDMPDAEWEFVLFKDNSPNAFALSGGKVGINTGLFKITNNDALLAAVLGHEISHATANHTEQRTLRAIGTAILGGFLWGVMDHNDVENPGYAIAAYTLAAYLIDTLPLARRQEYESDRLGAIYMAKAGYDPHQAIELWKKLECYHSKKNKKKRDPEYLRTHPLDSARIQALEDFMPIAMKYYHPKSSGTKKHQIRRNK